MTTNLKIMVVDDTITYRMILKKVVETIPGMDVTASASNGKLAMGKLESGDLPDLMLLDVEMPEMDGLTTLRQIKLKFPQIVVIMVSGLSRSNANIVMECLNAGALDFVTKPLETNAEAAKNVLRESLEPILILTAKKMRPHAMGGEPQAAAPPPPRFQPFAPPVAAAPAPIAPPAPRLHHGINRAPRPDLLLIGSSTGGPAALTKILSSITKKLTVPLLIVQHMPPVFTASLASQLTRSGIIEVREARDGLALAPNKGILAMGGKHMILQTKDGMKVAINEGPKVNECRPAVDVLFMSVATSFTGNVLSIILTGMGKDGAKGVEALKRIGNKTFCVTQEKESCVVYGMPRAVDEMGLSDESLPLENIGARIMELCC